MEKCKLCREDKTLSYSHILPEYFFTPVYRKNHKLFQVKLDYPEGKKAYNKHQKGFREYLLCRDCEERFEKLESYFKHQIYGYSKVLPTKHNLDFDPTVSLLTKKLDVEKLKRFQLSIFWRSSIATLPFFSSVNLGPDKEEKIRNILLSDQPIDFNEFPFVVTAVFNNDLHVIDVLDEPLETAYNGQKCYQFFFGGFLWYFFPEPFNEDQPTRQLHQLYENTCFFALKMDASRLKFFSYWRSKIEDFKSESLIPDWL